MSGDVLEDGGGAVICPKCHRVHYPSRMPVDEYIDCECGFSFYAFADRGLRIIMTASEASCEPVARAMRRFVVSTGRCQDIPYELYRPLEGETLYEMNVHERDLDAQMMDILEEYQLAAFGECFLTKDVIDAVCETFQKDNGVILENHHDKVKVKEMRVRNVSKPSMPQMAQQRSVAHMYSAKHQCTPGGILMVCQGAKQNQIRN